MVKGAHPFSEKNPLSSILRVPYWPTGRSVYILYFKCTIRPKVGWVCSVRQLGSGKYLQTWQSEPCFRLNILILIFSTRGHLQVEGYPHYIPRQKICASFSCEDDSCLVAVFMHLFPPVQVTEFHANFPRTSNASGYNMLPYWFGVDWKYLANAFATVNVLKQNLCRSWQDKELQTITNYVIFFWLVSYHLADRITLTKNCSALTQ